jgi:hypothetical protein
MPVAHPPGIDHSGFVGGSHPRSKALRGKGIELADHVEAHEFVVRQLRQHLVLTDLVPRLG